MNLKLFSILSFLGILLSFAVHATDTLLTYNWGNQIEHSYFTIFNDGSIEHKEWINFQMRQVPERPLSGAELLSVKSLVLEAGKGKVTSSNSTPSYGSMSGILSVRLKNGKMKHIEGVLRLEGNKTKLLRSNSPATRELKRIIEEYVSNIEAVK